MSVWSHIIKAIESSTVWKSDFLICPACQFGKQKLSYKSSLLDTHSISIAGKHLDNCVSVDINYSPIDGLFSQNRGKPCMEEYKFPMHLCWPCDSADTCCLLKHYLCQVNSSIKTFFGIFFINAWYHCLEILCQQQQCIQQTGIWRINHCGISTDWFLRYLHSPSKFNCRANDSNHHILG